VIGVCECIVSNLPIPDVTDSGVRVKPDGSIVLCADITCRRCDRNPPHPGVRIHRVEDVEEEEEGEKTGEGRQVDDSREQVKMAFR
jgi:hypothetical protein